MESAEHSRLLKPRWFQPGTGEVLDIPSDFVIFHDTEIVEYPEDALVSKYFDYWFENNEHYTLKHQTDHDLLRCSSSFARLNILFPPIQITKSHPGSFDISLNLHISKLHSTHFTQQ